MVVLLGSCATPKNVAYFQGIESLTAEQKAAMNQKYTPKICIDDALIINVTSSDRESVSPFTAPQYGYFQPGEAAIGISATTQNLTTYLVDEDGYITYPILGRVYLAGLTVNETNRKLQELIWETAPKAIVSVQISNFKIGVLGEVKTPDVFTVKTPRVSILDAVAMGGDITILGDRQNVWLVRDNNGEKEHVRLDLTDPAIFASPYYYLQQNDMVYVMPNKAQKRASQVSTQDGVRISLLSVIVTSASIITSAFLTLRGQNR